MKQLVRERGRLTVAAFMDLALYHPELGYYSRATQRSGRAGDFFTSVDVGPLFGTLLEVQVAEMAKLLSHQPSAFSHQPSAFSHQPSVFSLQPFELVEAGAGNGRLAADILHAARERDPDVYAAARLHLVEASATARDAQHVTLGDAAERLVSSTAALPGSFEGVLVANELLDAMPVHQVVMRDEGLREVYVECSADGRELHTVEGPPSTPELEAYLSRVGVALEPGWRVEINLAAERFVRDAARTLRRGFMIVIDYGHEARKLYSLSHAAGTLTTFSGHHSRGPEATDRSPVWLLDPGEQDITAHVDFTAIRLAAEAEGMTTIGFLDQTYFLLGLLPAIRDPQSVGRSLKTLVMPGGLGSTLKVLILGKGVGAPALQGCSYRVRVT